MSDKTASSIKAEKAARQALELKQEGAELSPARPYDLTYAHLRLGIDVGSTTVKLAVIDDNDNLIYANYERHHTDVRATAKELFIRAQRVIGDAPMRVSITGSGGMLLAKWLGLEFVQEVIASKRAVETLIPQTDCAIELGGEDAKIIYFENGIEQRMNGTCAGGTGAFIDQMAALLNTDAGGLNTLAQNATTIYPIASRCGVFAKTDVQPLLNEGARKEDIAASIFQSVVTQTISGLACGRPIRGYVAFLGGPLQYLPELRKRFYETLDLDEEHRIVPDNAHLFVASGCAIAGAASSTVRAEKLSDVLDRLKNLGDIQGSEVVRLPPLFANEAELDEFNERHAAECVKRESLMDYTGVAYLGIDAGSTTFKATLIDEEGSLLWSHYVSNKGDVLGCAKAAIAKLYNDMPVDAETGEPLITIGHATVTGYGEALLLEALRVDSGEIETVAHLRGAQQMLPGVEFILDIGGQDMKCLRVKDGVIDHIMLNEACSSGCGSFIESFATGLNLDVSEFAKTAIHAENPVDLGSRCTVFMNSRVKQAQKEGATVGDIAAGLAISVIKNALFKVIKIRDPHDVGTKVIVQGGTFLNDAVLRAFEQLAGVHAVRPDIAGNMGAYGAALLARDRYRKQVAALESSHVQAEFNPEQAKESTAELAHALNSDQAEAADGRSEGCAASERSSSAASAAPQVESASVVPQVKSTLLSLEQIESLAPTHKTVRCKGCSNACLLTVNDFGKDENTGKHRRFITGNRCEKGAGALDKKSQQVPNLFEYKSKRLFDHYTPLSADKAPRGTVGIPRALNMYENYPFWFTLLTSLGFKVMISGRSSHELFETGIESIASENICYPAKLVHGHIKWLLNKGMKTIFYPCVSYEDNLVPNTDNHYNCPVVANYPLVVGANMPELRDPDVRYMHPYFNLANHELMVDRIVEEFAWASVSREEAETAVKAAYAEDKVFKHDVQQEGLKALAYMKEHDCRGIVLAGRPYHIDPEINHGIPETICALGMVVLSEDSICELQPGEKLDLTDFLSEGEEDPRKKNANGFRHVDDRKVTVNRMPLRVTNQWAYHSRLYAAAHFVASYPGLELVQLNSFGCGLDAITTDQVAEILADKADVYTLLKIDEVSNLGAAKIRLRSLKAAVEEREANKAREAAAAKAVQGPKSTGFRKTGSTAPTPGRQILLDSTMAANPKLTKAMRAASKRAAERDLQAAVASKNGTSDGTTGVTNAKNAKKSGHNNATMSRYAHREKFVKDMKKDYTIVAPQMSPIHFSLVESVIRSGGYKFDILKHASREDVETGLKYVNNDACYPAIMVIGQLIDAILEGKYDPDKVCLAITQTGGMCRATNYFGLIRKALIDAGYPQIPVIAISTQGLEDNPGFKVTPALLHRTVKALILGDLLMKCLYRVRPYEVEKGVANRLYEQWDVIVREALEHHGFSKTAAKTPWLKRRYLPYPVLAREIVKSFDALPLKDVPRKVRVGVVGEILVKYQPDANNHVVDVIESQDCEAVVPGIMEFMTTRPYITDWNEKYLGTGGNKTLYALMRWSLDRYNAPIKAAIATSHGKFKQDDPMPELVEKAAEVTSIGVQAGEGWLLTAEILELIEQGCPNVICAQPFACLPNHVTGRGMFGKIRRLHPEANIVSIDYDPGASEANQLNRIKLMIAAAKKAHKAKFADGDEPQGFTAAD